MDSFQSNSGKKQRKPRNQKDKNTAEKEPENPSISQPVDNNNKGSNPQPQRANRRQRNESSVNKTAEPQPVVAQVTEKKEIPEKFVVDHSNLKRETEEIAKLTKKFTKREITSNWHRYSATEGVPHSAEAEEGAPADFTELLQVPASRGGHLQLKDEQMWSTASGAELSGYFALDLKVLRQSLACLPLYEQFRLPKELFSEEELNHFNILADQAKKCYNPDKIEDPNSKVQKLLTNLIQTESDLHEASSLKRLDQAPNVIEKTDNNVSFNILDVEGSTEKLLNMVESENVLNKAQTHSLENVDNYKLNLTKTTIDMSEEPKVNFVVEKEDIFRKDQNIIQPDDNFVIKLEDIDFSKENSPEKVVNRSSEKELILAPTETDLDNKTKPEESMDKLKDISLFDKSVISNVIIVDKVEETPSKKELENKVKEHRDFNKDKIDTESKQKHTKKNDNRKSTELNTRKTPDRTKEKILEDDDDLDFLLSLKKPIPPQTKKEPKTNLVKDSSFLPGKTALPKPTNPEQHSELDDWLDSVLED